MEPGQLLAVVVPHEQEVDAWDAFAEGTACVLEVVGIVILQPRVHEYDEEVRALGLLDARDPVACRDEYIVEVQALPQMLGDPLRDGGRGEAEDGDAQA